jgi:hypothetical protein
VVAVAGALVVAGVVIFLLNSERVDPALVGAEPDAEGSTTPSDGHFKRVNDLRRAEAVRARHRRREATERPPDVGAFVIVPDPQEWTELRAEIGAHLQTVVLGCQLQAANAEFAIEVMMSHDLDEAVIMDTSEGSEGAVTPDELECISSGFAELVLVSDDSALDRLGYLGDDYAVFEMSVVWSG